MDDSSSSKRNKWKSSHQNLATEQQAILSNFNQQSANKHDPSVSIGDLWCKLSALLTLQTLYVMTIQENSRLKTRMEKLEKRYFEEREQWRLTSTATTVTATTVTANASALIESNGYSGGESLSSATFRDMQMHIERLEKMTNNVEDKSASTLVRVSSLNCTIVCTCGSCLQYLVL